MKNQKTRTMPYKVWQILDFLVLKTLKLVVVNMLQKQINVKLLKSCFESYRNLWFLIDQKVKNKYWMINVAMNMNKIIIRDVNLSFNVEKFSKEFAKYILLSRSIFFSNMIKWYWSKSLEIWLRSWFLWVCFEWLDFRRTQSIRWHSSFE